MNTSQTETAEAMFYAAMRLAATYLQDTFVPGDTRESAVEAFHTVCKAGGGQDYEDAANLGPKDAKGLFGPILDDKPVQDLYGRAFAAASSLPLEPQLMLAKKYCPFEVARTFKLVKDDRVKAFFARANRASR